MLKVDKSKKVVQYKNITDDEQALLTAYIQAGFDIQPYKRRSVTAEDCYAAIEANKNKTDDEKKKDVAQFNKDKRSPSKGGIGFFCAKKKLIEKGYDIQ